MTYMSGWYNTKATTKLLLVFLAKVRISDLPYLDPAEI